MGTREVYEEKLRTGNLHHDPTINPGLGSARCPRCLSLLNPNFERGEWTITPVLHDATAVAGSGIGGMLGFVHGFNTGLKGFVFYLLLMAFTSLGLVAKAKFSTHTYFDSWNRVLLDGFLGGLMSFVLFWTFAYDIVHIF